MQIAVTFRHMETDEGVKDYVKGKIRRLKKFVENPREVHVVLSVEKFRHSAELTIVGDGVTLNSKGRDRDLFAAIDQMVDKMDRQIRERREKVKRKRGNSLLSGVAPRGEEVSTGGNGEAETSFPFRRKRIPAKPMSLEEAMAQMKLSGEEFLFFINSDSGEMNALHRKNGGYEWMEPSPE
jgi:putative sigma-54 modulation protein